jgi:hypothetical protein
MNPFIKQVQALTDRYISERASSFSNSRSDAVRFLSIVMATTWGNELYYATKKKATVRECVEFKWSLEREIEKLIEESMATASAKVLARSKKTNRRKTPSK